MLHKLLLYKADSKWRKRRGWFLSLHLRLRVISYNINLWFWFFINDYFCHYSQQGAKRFCRCMGTGTGKLRLAGLIQI